MATLINGSRVISGTLNYGTAGGSSNAYTLALSPAVAVLTDGMLVAVKANHTNTGASTLNLGGTGAVAIKKHGGTDLASGDIANNQVFVVQYVNSVWQMISHLGNAPAGGSVNPAKSAWFPWPVTSAHSPQSIGSLGAATNVLWIIGVPGPPGKMEAANAIAHLSASDSGGGIVIGLYEKTASDTLTLRAATSAVLGSGSAGLHSLAWNSGAWVSGGVLTIDPSTLVGQLYWGVGLEHGTNGNFIAAGSLQDLIKLFDHFGRTNSGALSGTGTGLTLPATVTPSTAITVTTTMYPPYLGTERF